MIFRDANTALVAISIAASCGAIAVIHALAQDWFGCKVARCAGVIFLFSPLAWFHGTVALVYIVEAFFSALAGYLCWRVCRGDARLNIPSAVVLGIAAGFRPSSLLLLGPLWLFSLRGLPLVAAIRGAACVVLAVAAWWVPMVSESGGQAAYLDAFLSLWQTVPGKQTVAGSVFASSVARVATILGISLLCYGSCALLLLAAFRRSDRPTDRGKIIFTWVWIAPGLLFFSLIYLRFVNSGYLLLLVAPACIWLGKWGWEWYSDGPAGTAWKPVLAGSAALVNLGIFLWAPVYCSHRSVLQFEKELERIERSLPRVAPPGNTLVVGFDSHFLGYRHSGYYLPEYTTIEYPEVRVLTGGQPAKRVFAMEHRDTRLLRQVPSGHYDRFVLFPLPDSGDEYHRYLRQIRSRFGEGELQSKFVDGQEYLTGPLSQLSKLFPHTAAPCCGVTGELHPGQGTVYSRLRQSVLPAADPR